MMKRTAKVVILTSLALGSNAASAQAKSLATPRTDKTEVVIIGTIHQFHYGNPKYGPDVLKQIILSLKPDAILNELPLSLVDPNGKPLKRVRSKSGSCPEIWAADEVAMDLGIKQIPFDRPDRQENFKKTNYFERQKRSDRLGNKWYEHLVKEEPNSLDIRIARLRGYAGQAEAQLFEHSDPQIINSEGHDSIIRIKHSLWYDIMPTILKEYPAYKTLIEDYHFFRNQWHERNRIMADNITKTVKQYPGKRLVVVTGATHRYILRDLLKDEPSIDLKEYWEIIEPAVEETQEPEAAKQESPTQAPRPSLTRDERLCGIVKLWAAVEYNYALMQYAEVDWDQVLPQYIRLAAQAEDDTEYFLLLEQMLALLKDNHTHLKDIPGRENLHKPNVYLEVVEGQYVVTGFYNDSNSHPNLRRGDALATVDGKEVKQAVEEVKAYICASSETERVNRALDRMLWRKKATDVVLTIKRLETTFDVTLPADIPYRRQRWLAGFDFSHRLLENKYGYMRISNFWSEQVAEEFTKAIEDLKECEGLILDLRDNGGGNENYGSQIAGRLVRERIRWYHWCGPTDQSVQPRTDCKKLKEKSAKDVDELRLEMGRSTGPSGPWQYHGPVVILVNWRTGSAAEGFVGTLQDCGRAAIIGERTAGGTGNPYHVDLPGGATGRICRIGIVRLDGSRFHGVGIKPDIPVKRTIKAIAEGRDEVLHAAMDYLRALDTEQNAVGDFSALLALRGSQRQCQEHRDRLGIHVQVD